MFIFRNELRALLETVRSGRCVHLVAPRGMGATTVLDRLTASLEVEGYNVVRIHGHAYNTHAEYSALQEAGVGVTRGVRSLGGLIDAVADELAGAARHAVLVDRVEAVDRGSLAIIQAAVERTGTPLVIARSSDFLALRRAGVNLTLMHGARVTLTPLDYVGTARLVQSHLGHQPSSEILSRVFARSNGITGLIIAVLDGALSNGLIELVDGRWVMNGADLWSPTVEGWLEERMAALSVEQIEALQHLALVHGSLEDEPCTRLEPKMLRQLDGLGLMWASVHDGRVTYTIDPPALVSYFHHRVNGETRLESDDDGSATVQRAVGFHSGRVAQNVRTYREAQERTVAESLRRWENAHTVATALPCLTVLLGSPTNARTAQRVFEETPLSTARDADEAFDFVFLRSTWQEHFSPDRPPTLDEFDDLLQRFPEWRESTLAFTCLISGQPLPVESCFDPDSADFIGPKPGGALALSAYAFGKLMAADFSAALEIIAKMPPSRLLVVNRHKSFVTNLALLAKGSFTSALTTSRAALEQGLVDVDHGAILLHSYVSTIALLALGRWKEAMEVVDQALAFGSPGPVDASTYRALLYCGSYIKASAGEPRVAGLFLAEADSFSIHDQPLPWMQREMSNVLRSLIDGDLPEGTARLRDMCRQLTERGQLFAALFGLRLALVTWPDAPAFELLLEVSELAGRPLPESVIDFLRLAISAPEPPTTLEDARIPHHYLASVSMILMARLRQEHSMAGLSTAALADALQRIQKRLDGKASHISPAPWSRPSSTARSDLLSRREREVAILARSHANSEIADRLGLSVRTVESHIHNAFKKLGVTTRQELIDAVGD